MKIVKRNKKIEGEDMAHNINLDDLKKDLDDLAVDLLTPPEKLAVVDLLEDRLETHKKLRSIINHYLNFKFIN
tara:strand:- start:372 stop:590 length:219 start_codon:yes stop_codon:yes gene_type:complete